MNDPTLKKEPVRYDLLIAVAGAFVYRLIFLWASPRVIDSADSIQYIDIAKQFITGQYLDFSTRIPPLYPALIAAVHFCVHDYERAGLIVSFLASTLLVVPVYMLAREVHSKRVGRVAALIICIWPWLVDYGCRVAPEALSTLLWFSAVYALAMAMRGGWGWTVAAPFLFFGLHLTRPEGTFIMLGAPIAALALGIKDRWTDARLIRMIPVVAIGAALLFAYAWYMFRVTGQATLVARAPDTSDAMNYVFVQHGLDIARTAIRLFGDVLPTMLGPYILIFAGAGLFASTYARRDLRLELVILGFAALQFVLASMSTFAEPRYIMPVAIAASIWAARGMLLVSDQANRLARYRVMSLLPVGGFVLLMLVGLASIMVPHYLGRMTYEPVEYKIAGRWMKENIQPGLILSRKPQVGFYADMPTSGPDPKDSIDDIVARARQSGARYLVVDERYSTNMIPSLKPLLDPRNAPPALRLVKDDLSPYHEGGRIVIYEFVPAAGYGGRP